MNEETQWRRLHPLSPLLRGGLALIIVLGIIVANFRDQILRLFVSDRIGDELAVMQEWGPGRVIDYVVANDLVIVAVGAILGILLLITGISWLSWRFLTYRITDEAVEERSGVIFRQHRRAPLDRIQNVNLHRSLLARILGATAVEVSTGGSGGKVSLRFLGHADATRVREQILRAVAKRQGRAESPETVPSASAAPEAGHARPASVQDFLEARARDIADFDVDPAAAAAGALVRVPHGRLLASIALSTEVFILVLLVIGVFIGSIWATPFVLFTLLPLTLAFIGIVIGQANTGWGFTLSRSSDGIRIGAGLTSTTTETVPFGRIHAVEVRQPLGWRFTGWWKMRITTAGHSLARGGQNKLQNTVLPVGGIDEVLRVLDAILRNEFAPAQTESLRDGIIGPAEHYLKPRARSRWLLGPAGRRAGISIDQSDAVGPTLRIRSGAMTRKFAILPLGRAQSVQLARPPLHWLFGLAMIQADTVLGPIRLIRRGLDRRDAEAFFEELAAAVVGAQQLEAPVSPANQGVNR